ncbi:MAG: hypothetical protein LBN71_03085, partial [Tannerella sp.]|nr:hypothetical protein [Tannerella sp.]
MKHKVIYLTFFAVALTLSGCEKESAPTASDNLGIIEMFSPGPNDAPEVKQIFNDYGVWVRTYFATVRDLTNAILEVDNLVLNRGAQNLDPERAGEVYMYTQTLLSNVSKEFTNAFFPLEFYYVKSYGASYWVYPLKRLGRSRIIITWPNTTAGTIPVTNPQQHYYQDSVLTVGVWNLIVPAITARMEEPVYEFVSAGKAYDNGKAYNRILEEFRTDAAKREAALADLTRNGGYITGNGTYDFSSDFAEWICLLATESYENIKRDYLDDSK